MDVLLVGHVKGLVSPYPKGSHSGELIADWVSRFENPPLKPRLD